MSIEVTCIECGAVHSVNNRLAGRRVRCPKCDTAVHVPEKVVETKAPDVEPILVEPEPEPILAEPEAPPEPSPAPSATSSPTGDESNLIAAPSASAIATLDDDEDEEPVLPRRNRPEQEMDMTPMVDVTFLLLIFFMVTAAFSLQKSIEMPRQQTDAPSTNVEDEETEDLDMVEVEVDEYGAFLVMAPDWERETPGKQNLVTALKEAIAGSTSGGMRLVIKVHEMAKLHALVDAMDAGTIAGYAELEVTQVEEFN